jgi:CheY-like chemotaxis protein
MRHDPFFLIAEDSDDDVFLLTRAFHKVGLYTFQFVRDGIEVLQYLQGLSQFADRELHPYPRFLMLDLKMPRMGGLEVLRWLQGNRERCIVPTVVCSSSAEDSDIRDAYAAGAHTYFQKRHQSSEMGEVVSTMTKYWSKAALPLRDALQPRVLQVA